MIFHLKPVFSHWYMNITMVALEKAHKLSQSFCALVVTSSLNPSLDSTWQNMSSCHPIPVNFTHACAPEKTYCWWLRNWSALMNHGKACQRQTERERERYIYIYFYILHKFIVYVSSVYVLKALRIQYTSKLCTAMWNPCIRPLFSLQKWFQHVSRWLAWCGAGLDLNTACGLDVLGDASWPPSVVVSPAGDRPVASKMTRS